MKKQTDLDKALFEAVGKADLLKVKQLIAAGANPEVKRDSNETLLHRALQGQSADHVADSEEVLEMVKFLVEEVGLAVEDVPAIAHEAAWWRRPLVVEYLLQKGADINEKNDCGQTPLWVAIQETAPLVVKVLLNKGASFSQGEIECAENLVDLYKESSRKDFAQASKEILEMLHAHMCSK